MASDSQQQDPLQLLRLSISTGTPPILCTSTTLPPSSLPPTPLHLATHLIFRVPSTIPIPLPTPTRFHKKDGDNPGPVDLRSIYFAWLNKDLAIPDYVALAQSFAGTTAAAGGGAEIKNLVFVERLELVGWLEGVQEDSDFIVPIAQVGAGADGKGRGSAPGAGPGGMVVGRGRGDAGAGVGGVGGQVPGGGVVGPGGSATGGPRPARQIDPRLMEIYSHERVVVNRNTALRGTKPMDFGYVRRHTEDFVSRLKNTAGATNSSALKPGIPGSTPIKSDYSSIPPHPPGKPSSNSLTPHKPSRSFPIILLSPSASALLNMSNVKPFLESGTFIPPGTHSTAATTTPQMIDISRLLPSINPSTPQRFIVVDSPEKFKPEYWARVVAVFTTGQAWQFKSYKWHNPADLFRHIKGFYVGWEGDVVPESVRGWGAGVTCVGVERSRRFRDREVCEVVWMEIERWMTSMGWGGQRGM